MSAEAEPSKLARLKLKLEPAVWLVGIVCGIFGTLTPLAWKYVGQGVVESYVRTVIDSREKDDRATLSRIDDSVKKLDSITDSFRSIVYNNAAFVYIMSKSYEIGDVNQEQDALQGFFYSSPADQVSLSIFTTEHHPDMFVSLNGSSQISLKDVAAKQQKTTWSNVEISDFILGHRLRMRNISICRLM